MQVNMLEAKNQLSRLVKAAVAGEEVVIASNGQALVRMVPCAPTSGLRDWGAWASQSIDIEAAFAEDADTEVARLFDGA